VGETETRTVETEFTAKDAGYGAAMERMLETYRKGAEHLAELKNKLGEFRQETGLSTLGALGLGVGIGSWVEHAREVNAEFGRTEKGIAGVLAGALKFEKGATEIDRYRRSLVLSKDITEELEEASVKYGASLDDIQGAYRTVISAAGPMHLSQKQVMDLTKEATATAKRFQVTGEEAAGAVARALQTGRVKGIDPFAISLHNAVGNMQHLSQAGRLQHLEKALRGSMQVAEEMNNGIDGSLARARQTVDSVFRGATAPLFHEVALDLSAWAKHLKEARDNGRPLIEDVSGKLVTGLHAVEAVSGFIKDHWIAIGAVFAGLKAGQMATSIGGALGTAGGAMGSGALSGLGGIFGMIGKVAPAFGGIVTAAGLAAIALHGVYEEWQGRKKAAGELGGFFDEIGKAAKTTAYVRKHDAELSPYQIEGVKREAAAHAQAAAEILKQKGLFENGAISLEKFNGVMDSMSDDVKRSFAGRIPGAGDLSSSGQLGAMAAEILQQSLAATAAATSSTIDDTARKVSGPPVQNFNGGIHIQQKFEDADPDRVFLRFKSDLEGLASTPMQSREAEHESH